MSTPFQRAADASVDGGQPGTPYGFRIGSRAGALGRRRDLTQGGTIASSSAASPASAPPLPNPSPRHRPYREHLHIVPPELAAAAGRRRRPRSSSLPRMDTPARRTTGPIPGASQSFHAYPRSTTGTTTGPATGPSSGSALGSASGYAPTAARSYEYPSPGSRGPLSRSLPPPSRTLSLNRTTTGRAARGGSSGGHQTTPRRKPAGNRAGALPQTPTELDRLLSRPARHVSGRVDHAIESSYAHDSDLSRIRAEIELEILGPCHLAPMVPMVASGREARGEGVHGVRGVGGVGAGRVRVAPAGPPGSAGGGAVPSVRLGRRATSRRVRGRGGSGGGSGGRGGGGVMSPTMSRAARPDPPLASMVATRPEDTSFTRFIDEQTGSGAAVGAAAGYDGGGVGAGKGARDGVMLTMDNAFSPPRRGGGDPWGGAGSIDLQSDFGSVVGRLNTEGEGKGEGEYTYERRSGGGGGGRGGGGGEVDREHAWEHDRGGEGGGGGEQRGGGDAVDMSISISIKGAGATTVKLGSPTVLVLGNNDATTGVHRTLSPFLGAGAASPPRSPRGSSPSPSSQLDNLDSLLGFDTATAPLGGGGGMGGGRNIDALNASIGPASHGEAALERTFNREFDQGYNAHHHPTPPVVPQHQDVRAGSTRTWGVGDLDLRIMDHGSWIWTGSIV